MDRRCCLYEGSYGADSAWTFLKIRLSRFFVPMNAILDLLRKPRVFALHRLAGPTGALEHYACHMNSTEIFI